MSLQHEFVICLPPIPFGGILKEQFMKSPLQLETNISAGRHINYALEICRLITEPKQWNVIKGTSRECVYVDIYTQGPQTPSGRKMQKVTQSKTESGSLEVLVRVCWHCKAQVSHCRLLRSL